MTRVDQGRGSGNRRVPRAIIVLGGVWAVGSWLTNGYPEVGSVLVLSAGVGALAWMEISARIAQVDARCDQTPLDDLL